MKFSYSPLKVGEDTIGWQSERLDAIVVADMLDDRQGFGISEPVLKVGPEEDRSAVEKQVWISAVSVSFCWSLLLTFGATKTGFQSVVQCSCSIRGAWSPSPAGLSSSPSLSPLLSTLLSDRGKTRAGIYY